MVNKSIACIFLKKAAQAEINPIVVGENFKQLHFFQRRRFKKWGMGGSKSKAFHLLKLWVLEYDPEAWDEFWIHPEGTINHTAKVDVNRFIYSLALSLPPR